MPDTDKTREAFGKLREILNRAEKAGCTASEIARLEIVGKLLKKSSEEKSQGIFKYRIFFVVGAILTIFFYATNAHTLQGFSTIWLKWNYGNVNDHPVSKKNILFFRLNPSLH